MFKHQKHIQISKYSAVSETRSSLEAQKTQRKVFIKQKRLYSSDDEYSTAENCHISNKLVEESFCSLYLWAGVDHVFINM